VWAGLAKRVCVNSKGSGARDGGSDGPPISPGAESGQAFALGKRFPVVQLLQRRDESKYTGAEENPQHEEDR